MSTWFSVVRQAWRNVRSRPVSSAMLLIALTLATSSIAIATNVRAAADGAIQRLSDATNGYHVYVKSFTGPDTPQSDRDAATQAMRDLTELDRVIAIGGPWPTLLGSISIDGSPLEVRVQVRDTTTSPVGQPFVTAGRWLDAGDGVVVEDGLADSLNLEPGDTLEISGHRLEVLGTAMTTSTQRFPIEAPGLVWISQRAAAGFAGSPGYKWIELRIDDPLDSADVAARIEQSLPRAAQLQWEVHEWQERRAEEEASNPVNDLGLALLVAGVLMSMLTAATAAVLIGSRLSARSRQIGILKAIGMEPLHVTAVFAVEAVALAAFSIVVGIAAGAVAAPRLANTVTTLYGGPQVAVFDPTRIALLAAISTALVTIAVVNPARKAARTPTTGLLQPPVTAPRHVGPFGRLARRTGLPVTVAVAIRSVGRRRGRVSANVASLALAVALAILGLSLRGSAPLPQLSPGEPRNALVDAAASELFHKLRAVVLIAAALLIVLAALNTVVTAAFAVNDARRNHATLATLGATHRQIATGFIAAQITVAGVATLVGVLLGRAMYAVFASDLGPPTLRPLTYTVVVVATLAGYTIALLAPLLRQANTPISTTLATERV